MGYRHISNLYQNKEIMLFKQCYALEKINGTSSHIIYNATNDQLHFSSGGASYDLFVSLFNKEELLEKFRANRVEHPEVDKITVYGEAYGGKIQGMSHTYGPNLCFTAFEVQVMEEWLGVLLAEKLATRFGFEFVPYELIDCTEEAINAARDSDSVVAVRRGMGPGHQREGVVLRPVIELQHPNGGRVISKHKHPKFEEKARAPKSLNDPEQEKILSAANEIADEWMVMNRATNILSHWKEEDIKIENTKRFISAAIEDVTREAAGQIQMSEAAVKAISRKAAQLFKQHLNSKTFE